MLDPRYEEIIHRIITKYSLEIFHKPFLFRCIISDYIKSDYYLNILINVLYDELKVNHEELLNELQNSSLSNIHNYLLNRYKTLYKDKYKVSDFKDSFNPIIKYFHPDEYDAYHLNKVKNNENKVKVNLNNNNKVIVHKENKKNDIKNKDELIYLAKTFNNKNTLNNFHSFKIDIKAKNFEICVRQVKNVELYIDDKKDNNFLNNSHILKDTLYLNIVKPNKEIKLIIPSSMDINNFVIDSNDTAIYCMEILKVKRLKFTKNTGFIYLVLNAEKLVYDIDKGYVTLGGDIKEVKGEANQATINLLVNLHNYDNYSFNIQNQKGNIKAKFNDKSIFMKFPSLIFNPHYLVDYKVIDGKQVYINLYSNEGHIKYL